MAIGRLTAKKLESIQREMVGCCHKGGTGVYVASNSLDRANGTDWPAPRYESARICCRCEVQRERQTWRSPDILSRTPRPERYGGHFRTSGPHGARRVPPPAHGFIFGNRELRLRLEMADHLRHRQINDNSRGKLKATLLPEIARAEGSTFDCRRHFFLWYLLGYSGEAAVYPCICWVPLWV